MTQDEQKKVWIVAMYEGPDGFYTSIYQELGEGWHHPSDMYKVGSYSCGTEMEALQLERDINMRRPGHHAGRSRTFRR